MNCISSNFSFCSLQKMAYLLSRHLLSFAGILVFLPVILHEIAPIQICEVSTFLKFLHLAYKAGM